MHSKSVSQHPSLIVGEPSLRSAEELRKLKHNCARRKDPNIIYMTVDIRNDLHAEWGFNTPKHFACEALTPEILVNLIHPVWQSINLAFRDENYVIAAELMARQEPLEVRFQFNLPLRRKDGKYYWFKQVVYPVTYDDNGNVVHFMKELRLMTDFDKLAPEKPSIYLEGSSDNAYTHRIQKAGELAFAQAFAHLISDAGFKLLDCYRSRVTFNGTKWTSPEKKEVEQTLGLSRSALNKAVVRLMGGVKQAAPAIVTETIGDFAGFLNDFFGTPA
ncbi:MAG: PAS domain-containing protein [Bacteroidota bacterium]